MFSIFSCSKFEDGSETLRADHLLSCQDDIYLFMQFYALIVGGVWVSMVVFYGWILFVNKGDLSDPIKSQDPRHDWLRFLVEPYKPQVFWWELVVTFTRLIMSGAIVLFEQGSVMQFSVGLLTMFTAVVHLKGEGVFDVIEDALALLHPHTHSLTHSLSLSQTP